MEKRVAHYPLDGIQAQFETMADLRLTRSARFGLREMGLRLVDAWAVIRGLGVRNFYKSMTCTACPRVWQDVYRSSWRDIPLYIKFQQDDEGYFVISFKRL